MTDTKPKDVCDTVDYGHGHVGIPVCVHLQRCRKVLGVCRFSCDLMTREPSPEFNAESLNLTLDSRIGGVPCRGSGCAVSATDQGVPCLPWIKMCRARGTLHLGSRYSTGSKKSGRSSTTANDFMLGKLVHLIFCALHIDS